ncbi:MAG: ParA family protein [Campylobacterales bacterium]|nr:ParA family protein [Campylobacterales bacterium]
MNKDIRHAVVISIENGKGGVCKTTTTKILAHEATRKGKKTLLIDLDPKQSNLTKGFGIEPFEGYTGENNISLIFQGDEVPTPIKLSELLDIIPAAYALEEVANFCPRGKELKLKKLVHEFKDKYDVILIDTNPGIEVLLTNATLAADIVVMPVEQAQNAAKGMERFFKNISDTMKIFSSENPRKFFIVPSKHDKRAKIDNLFLKDYELISKYANTLPCFNNKEVTVTDYIPQVNALFKKADANCSWSVQDFMNDYGPMNGDLMARLQMISGQILDLGQHNVE